MDNGHDAIATMITDALGNRAGNLASRDWSRSLPRNFRG
jgi:hypothetical protein